MDSEIGDINIFLVLLRSRLLSAGLEPVLSQTEKLCIESIYRQFSTNIKIKKIIINLLVSVLCFHYLRKNIFGPLYSAHYP